MTALFFMQALHYAHASAFMIVNFTKGKMSVTFGNEVTIHCLEDGLYEINGSSASFQVEIFYNDCSVVFDLEIPDEKHEKTKFVFWQSSEGKVFAQTYKRKKL